MADRLSFDTCFLIDIQKERKARLQGRAHDFLRHNQERIMLVSAIALGEFAEGVNASNHAAMIHIMSALEVLDVDAQISLLYGQNARRLRESGQLIGSNDLWIGCTAVRHGVPLVTRNDQHFDRISSLTVLTY